jgi:hypothetical protein
MTDNMTNAVRAIRNAFGAPGDYGYESKEGKALYALYLAHAEDQGAATRALIDAEAIAERHRSKIDVNEPLWHSGADWACDRIKEAIRAYRLSGNAKIAQDNGLCAEPPK